MNNLWYIYIVDLINDVLYIWFRLLNIYYSLLFISSLGVKDGLDMFFKFLKIFFGCILCMEEGRIWIKILIRCDKYFYRSVYKKEYGNLG